MGTGIGMVLGAILVGAIASQISYISIPLGIVIGLGAGGFVGFIKSR